jgi:flagellar basal body-associated protein FliL
MIRPLHVLVLAAFTSGCIAAHRGDLEPEHTLPPDAVVLQTDGTTPGAMSDRGEIQTFDLGHFRINISGSYSSRVLVMDLVVRGSPDSIETIESVHHQIRASILMLASEYTVSELYGIDGRLRLRDGIQRRIDLILSPAPPVQSVYFTQFHYE